MPLRAFKAFIFERLKHILKDHSLIILPDSGIIYDMFVLNTPAAIPSDVLGEEIAVYFDRGQNDKHQLIIYNKTKIHNLEQDRVLAYKGSLFYHFTENHDKNSKRIFVASSNFSNDQRQGIENSLTHFITRIIPSCRFFNDSMKVFVVGIGNGEFYFELPNNAGQLQFTGVIPDATNNQNQNYTSSLYVYSADVEKESRCDRSGQPLYKIIPPAEKLDCTIINPKGKAFAEDALVIRQDHAQYTTMYFPYTLFPKSVVESVMPHLGDVILRGLGQRYGLESTDEQADTPPADATRLFEDFLKELSLFGAKVTVGTKPSGKLFLVLSFDNATPYYSSQFLSEVLVTGEHFEAAKQNNESVVYTKNPICDQQEPLLNIIFKAMNDLRYFFAMNMLKQNPLGCLAEKKMTPLMFMHL